MAKASSYDKHLVQRTIWQIENSLLIFHNSLTKEDQAQVIAHFQKWFSTEGREAADASTEIANATFDHRA